MKRVIMILAATAMMFPAVAIGGPSRNQAAMELYNLLTAEDSEIHWWTEDAAGNPAMCVFRGWDDKAFVGAVFVSYTSYEGATEIVRTNMLRWQIIDGDILDIQDNHFVLTHMGRLHRLPAPGPAPTAAADWVQSRIGAGDVPPELVDEMWRLIGRGRMVQQIIKPGSW